MLVDNSKYHPLIRYASDQYLILYVSSDSSGNSEQKCTLKKYDIAKKEPTDLSILKS